MHQDFTATVVGSSLTTTTHATATELDSGEIVMDVIAPPECCDIFITKAQAMEFFNLVPSYVASNQEELDEMLNRIVSEGQSNST